MQNCCFKCGSTEGLKRYGVTEDGYIVSEEEERKIRKIRRIGLFSPRIIPKIDYSWFFCPKCAKSGKSS